MTSGRITNIPRLRHSVRVMGSKFSDRYDTVSYHQPCYNEPSFEQIEREYGLRVKDRFRQNVHVLEVRGEKPKN